MVPYLFVRTLETGAKALILCLDPGAKSAGCALFENGELTTAWLARGKNWRETADDVMKQMPVNAVLVQTVVIEYMQIYKDTPLAHANDCITLSHMSGRVTGYFSGCNVVEYRPGTWKGGVPKAIMTERILSKLSKDEYGRIETCPKSLFHNIVDAIGLGIRHSRGPRALGQ